MIGGSMHRAVYRGLVFGVAYVVAATALPAQTVDQIVAKYYQAAGGLTTMKAVHSTRMSGTASGPTGEAPFTRITLRPGLARVDFTIQGTTATQAYDGQTAWWFMPFMGQTAPDTMPSSLAANMKEEAVFDGPLVDYAVRGIQIELVGKEQVDSTSAYKLKVTMPSGSVLYYYLDADSYLPIRTEATRTIQGQSLTIVSTMSDYRPEGGLMIPHSIHVTQGPGTQSLVITKVEINPPLTPADFRMPPKPGGED
jgi:outer membrane lipoprotein-sorting protein